MGDMGDCLGAVFVLLYVCVPHRHVSDVGLLVFQINVCSFLYSSSHGSFLGTTFSKEC